MANRKLERMGIDPFVCERLAKNNISTVRELLAACPITVMLQADLSMRQLKDMISMVSDKLHAKPQSALVVMHARSQGSRFLSTGIDKFNTSLKGGLLVGSISEICGAPGAGKTQFCLNCALQAVSSSTAAGVIYIDTELKFDPNRLIQMAIETYPELYSSEFRTDAPHQIDNLLSKVKVKRPTTMKHLQEELGELQSSVIAQSVSLVIIDSIAALARKEGYNERDKEQFFITQASQLKKLSELCNCVILATNQVTPSGSANPSDLYGDAIHDDWGTYQPTLGPTWHHCVSTRLTMRILNRNTAATGGEGGQGVRREAPVRCLSITKSPVAPPFELEVMIAPRGVVEHIVG